MYLHLPIHYNPKHHALTTSPPQLSYQTYLFPSYPSTQSTIYSTSTTKMTESSFFASFPTFQHNPNAAVSSEFHRLAQHRQWKQGSRNWKKNWNRCVNTEYDRILGNNVVYLDDWIELCEELGLDGDFTSIRKCKMVCMPLSTYLST